MPRNRHQNGFVKPTGKKPRTWTGYWYIYEGSKRKERSKVLGTRTELTKGQAEDKLREIIRAGGLQGPQAQPKTFKTAAIQYLELKSGDWGVSQKSVIRCLFHLHILPVIGEFKVAEIKPSDIKTLFNQVAEKSSQSYVKKAVTHVRAVFEMLVEDEAIPRNPAKAQMVTMPKTRKPSERFLGMDECKALLKTAAAKESKQDYVILRIFLSCALRPSEVFALRLEDVSPGKLMIDEADVQRQGVVETKTEGSEAPVPTSSALDAEIQAYILKKEIHHPKEFLFSTRRGRPIAHNNWLKRNLKKLAVEAGITGLVNHQVLRRTVATHMQKHGEVKSAQALLRHSDASTTLKHYQKTLEESVITAHNSWDRALTEKVQ